MLLDKEFLEAVAENGKLRVRIAELETALDDMHKGHDAICKYVSELEEALKPFAVKDTEVTPERQYYDMLVKHEDRVRARAALKGEKNG